MVTFPIQESSNKVNLCEVIIVDEIGTEARLPPRTPLSEVKDRTQQYPGKSDNEPCPLGSVGNDSVTPGDEARRRAPLRQ
jgi:hypothetical protein